MTSLTTELSSFSWEIRADALLTDTPRASPISVAVIAWSAFLSTSRMESFRVSFSIWVLVAFLGRAFFLLSSSISWLTKSTISESLAQTVAIRANISFLVILITFYLSFAIRRIYVSGSYLPVITLSFVRFPFLILHIYYTTFFKFCQGPLSFAIPLWFGRLCGFYFLSLPYIIIISHFLFFVNARTIEHWPEGRERRVASLQFSIEPQNLFSPFPYLTYILYHVFKKMSRPERARWP